VQLNIFSAMQQDWQSAKIIAEKIHGDLRATEILLQALAGLGLIRQQKGCYANTEESRRYLVPTSSEYIGHIILHHSHLVIPWAKLKDVVLNGQPSHIRPKLDASDPQTLAEREHFLMGMFNMGMAVAPRVAEILPLQGCNCLLDLGGGPGTYAIHFCLANPHLQAILFDLPTSQPFATKTIAQFGLSHRIQFLGGDYLVDELPQGYDVVWISHILHAEGPEQAALILKKAVQNLKPGGMIFIHDFMLQDSKTAPLFAALFSINMLVNTQQGKSYTEQEIQALLTDIGIQDIQRLPFLGPNESCILAGSKKA